MRLAVTVVSPATGQQADVVIDADPETAVAEIAAELDRLMHGDGRRRDCAGFRATVRRAVPAAALPSARLPRCSSAATGCPAT